MLEKTIRAIQFIAKPAVNFATKATAKVAEQAIPRTTEFIKTWQREWDKDASNFKPTIIQPLAKPNNSGTRGIYNPDTHQHECDICSTPWDMDNHCCPKYKCWK
jgi:hypothetical protein